jgi:hypothetical protein
MHSNYRGLDIRPFARPGSPYGADFQHGAPPIRHGPRAEFTVP